jgi:phosphocarrier protein HPr
MADRTETRIVKVDNPLGLHVRPAEMLARTAGQFQAKIEVIKNGQRVDGKSILNILTLSAEQGNELSLEATGPDAVEALDALSELFARGFDENGNVKS